MLNQQSITLPAPATTAPELTISELIKKAIEQTRIASRIVQGFDDLDQITFDELDQIGRNCVNARRNLETIQQRLAESEVAAV
jgi:hypothetical protein